MRPVEEPTPWVWLTPTEAAVEMRCSRRTIYNWLTKGVLVTRRTAIGRLRIRRDSLWAQEGARASASRARS